MPIKNSDLNYLSRSVKLASEANRSKAQEVLDLFKNRKISQFRTADNLILSLRIGNKKEVEQVSKILEPLRGATPITGILERTKRKMMITIML